VLFSGGTKFLKTHPKAASMILLFASQAPDNTESIVTGNRGNNSSTAKMTRIKESNTKLEIAIKIDLLTALIIIVMPSLFLQLSRYALAKLLAVSTVVLLILSY
jgi:hypothetical protein